VGQDFHALFIHGVGQQSADFAAEARVRLRAACVDRDRPFYSRSVHWAPYADRVQGAYLKAVEAAGSHGNPTQRLVIGTLADALMYQGSRQLRNQIYGAIDRQLVALRGQHVHVFAHSLGGLIFTDYLRHRQVKNVTLITFGCNIGLFNLGRPFVPVGALARKGAWLNVYSRRDMLGFPVNLGDPALAHVQDVQVGVGGVFKGWTGLAHVRYWDDRALWSTTLPKLLAL
jgi:pimeloyl-ACP methyl ester carboxylesterase